MVRLALSILLCLTAATTAVAADFSAERVTRETFAFSDFTEYMLRTKQDGSNEGNNPVMRAMKETLLRLYPPGSDINEFFAFLDNVVARELKNSTSIEDQSPYLKDGRKFGRGILPGGQQAVADYRFNLKFKAALIEPRAWMLPFSDFAYLMTIDLKDRKIADLRISRS